MNWLLLIIALYLFAMFYLALTALLNFANHRRTLNDPVFKKYVEKNNIRTTYDNE